MSAPEPYWSDETVTLYLGDCLDVLASMPDASIDAVVTDPPYGLEFMGREWDSFGTGGKQPRIGAPDGTPFRNKTGTPSWSGSGNPACQNCGGDKYRNGPRRCSCDAPTFVVESSAPNRAFQQWCEQWATECLRVLKPGGHLLAFGGTRTYHRLACGIEDAGFEVRDSIAWLYGSGFPKSLDVSKAIDRAAGVEREVKGPERSPFTDGAYTWQGWGTALKPAHEPIVVARKPLAGTVAANVLAHGTGALNVDGCRVAGVPPAKPRGAFVGSNNNMAMDGRTGTMSEPADAGRWPPNVLLDPGAAAELDRQSGTSASRIGQPRVATNGDGWGMTATGSEYDDQGGASRFFPTFRYEAKAPTSERPRVGKAGAGEGRVITGAKYAATKVCRVCGSKTIKPPDTGPSCGHADYEWQAVAPRTEHVAHPTVKPLDLMRWLVRLVTPPGGLVLDPFAGSGTTGEACVLGHMRAVLIEREPDYLPLIIARLTKPLAVGFDFGEPA